MLCNIFNFSHRSRNVLKCLKCPNNGYEITLCSARLISVPTQISSKLRECCMTNFIVVIIGLEGMRDWGGERGRILPWRLQVTWSHEYRNKWTHRISARNGLRLPPDFKIFLATEYFINTFSVKASYQWSVFLDFFNHNLSTFFDLFPESRDMKDVLASFCLLYISYINSKKKRTKMRTFKWFQRNRKNTQYVVKVFRWLHGLKWAKVGFVKLKYHMHWTKTVNDLMVNILLYTTIDGTIKFCLWRWRCRVG